MKNNYAKAFDRQERRFERANRKAEKHIKLACEHIHTATLYRAIAEDAVREQKKICEQEAAND